VSHSSAQAQSVSSSGRPVLGVEALRTVRPGLTSSVRSVRCGPDAVSEGCTAHARVEEHQRGRRLAVGHVRPWSKGRTPRPRYRINRSRSATLAWRSTPKVYRAAAGAQHAASRRAEPGRRARGLL